MTYWIIVGCAGNELAEPVRSKILAEVVEQCQSRGWMLLAAHVKSDGVQVVLTARETGDTVRRALVSALRRHWRQWNASDAIALQKRETGPALRATIGSPENLMAVFVAGA